MSDVVEQLEEDGLLEPSFLELLREEARIRAEAEAESEAEEEVPPRESPPHLIPLRLCHLGALRGGLSVALDVRADELLGSLCALIGGSARRLKILDVRERGRGVLELEVMLDELTEKWELEDLYTFVQNLNDLFRGDATARAVAVLGEWQDMLQLWCLKKADLPWLFRRRYFAPRNHHQLRSLFQKT